MGYCLKTECQSSAHRKNELRRFETGITGQKPHKGIENLTLGVFYSRNRTTLQILTRWAYPVLFPALRASEVCRILLYYREAGNSEDVFLLSYEMNSSHHISHKPWLLRSVGE